MPQPPQWRYEPPPPAVHSAQRRLAALVRHHGRDAPVVDDARRVLKLANIEDYLGRQLGQGPALTAEQVKRLITLLRGSL